MVRKILTICLLVTGSSLSQAQDLTTDKHEVSVYATGYMSNLIYTLKDDGSRSSRVGAGMGLGYTYNINEAFGVSTGLEYSNYGAKASYPRITGEYAATDYNGANFTLRYEARNFTEKHSVDMLLIPFTAQYKTGETVKYFVAGGFKVGFPIGTKAKLSQNLTTRGHYQYEDIVYEDLPQHNFFTNQPVSGKGKPKIGVAALLSIETGMRFTIDYKMYVYAGFFFDYGFTNVKTTSNRHIVDYNGEITYGSVLNTSLVNKIHLMNLGIKVRLGIQEILTIFDRL
jgi:hypothetical protein